MRLRFCLSARLFPLCAVGLVAVLGSCRLLGRDAGKTESSEPDAPPPQETGNCHNENVEGTCQLHIVLPLSPEHAPGPEGTVLCRVDHEIVTNDNRTFVVTSGYLRVPEDRVDELSQYYASHGDLACKAYIVRPPCNPDGTSVTMDLKPPDFARPEKF